MTRAMSDNYTCQLFRHLPSIDCTNPATTQWVVEQYPRILIPVCEKCQQLIIDSQRPVFTAIPKEIFIERMKERLRAIPAP